MKDVRLRWSWHSTLSKWQLTRKSSLFWNCWSPSFHWPCDPPTCTIEPHHYQFTREGRARKTGAITVDAVGRLRARACSTCLLTRAVLPINACIADRRKQQDISRWHLTRFPPRWQVSRHACFFHSARVVEGPDADYIQSDDRRGTVSEWEVQLSQYDILVPWSTKLFCL